MSDPLFLIARIAGRSVAFDAAEVDSVVDVDAVVPVPRVDPAVRGLSALRSRVVTVIDTWRMLGLDPSTEKAGRAIITRIADHDYAVLVDALEDVVALTSAPLPPGLALVGGWARAARAMVADARGPMLVLDLAELVPAHD